MTERTTLLILGASGDLTSRLLLPGLGSLLAVEPERQVRVMGADLADLAEDDFRAKIRTAFETAGVPAEATESIAASSRYLRADLLDAEQLGAVLDEAGAPLVIYFALPPQISIQVCALLEQRGVPEGTRLALEKPFGHDLDSARTFNQQLLRVVPEQQIHRVDHFLAVNTVLNLIGIRFSNRLLQPIWTSEHIERVEIWYDESLALEGRAGYYDKAGAMVDMLQSHLLVVLALFAMEPPAFLDAREMHPLKAQVLRSTQLWADSPARSSRRARYTAGQIDDKQIPNYVDEPGVDPTRDTETLAQVIVEVRNSRWSGVPFILRSGKAIGNQQKRIVVTFRDPVHLPGGMDDSGQPDRIVFELKPGAITFDLSMNAEGDPYTLEQKQLHAELGQARMTPYGEILAGILDSEPLLSIHGEVAEECWRIVGPVVQAWRSGEVPMEEYPAGSDGPQGWAEVPRIVG